MARTIAKPIRKGYGAKLYHRRLDNIVVDGEWLTATLRSTTLKGNGKSLVLTDDGWKLVEVERYHVGLNLATGEYSCDCPQGSLNRFCKHVERLNQYAQSKQLTK